MRHSVSVIFLIIFIVGLARPGSKAFAMDIRDARVPAAVVAGLGTLGYIWNYVHPWLQDPESLKSVYDFSMRIWYVFAKTEESPPSDKKEDAKTNLNQNNNHNTIHLNVHLASASKIVSEDKLKSVEPEFPMVRTKVGLRVNPFINVGNWYKGSRDILHVPELEWDLGCKGSHHMTFARAQTYTKSRAADGWRLPTLWELYTLYQQKSVLGDDLDENCFWSDTAVIGGNGSRWSIYFFDGHVGDDYGYDYSGVRLVRGGME